ncbi:hypothetical protein [Facklamia sp. 7083-14-GEN3]|uniref:hypothetical protein n=1 Tax=Facklamia sp. 7083-14-GEN3 TaxID=2973478 RepID=UPI00215CE9EC|nr:hypothetical protein [Facklamia sp. 7083-14-GEN3]MCR8969192.1 hypothetical protein [Facklamia sp. 7083-14-GEN3]
MTNIYDLLNDTEVEMNDYQELELDVQTKKNLWHNFRKLDPSNHKPVAFNSTLAIITASFLLMISPLGGSIHALTIKLVDEISFSMGQSLGLSYQGKTFSINQTAKIGDYTVKVIDLILDQKSMTINYLLEGDDLTVENPPIEINQQLLINGEEASISSYSGGTGKVQGHVLNNVTTYTFDKPIKLEKQNEIVFQLTGWFDPWNKKVISQESARFTFQGDPEALSGDSLYLEKDQIIETDRGELRLTQIRLHPYATNFVFKEEINDSNPRGFYELELEDKKGRKITFYESVTVSSPDNKTVESTFDFKNYEAEFTQEDLLKMDEVKARLLFTEMGDTIKDKNSLSIYDGNKKPTEIVSDTFTIKLK